MRRPSASTAERVRKQRSRAGHRRNPAPRAQTPRDLRRVRPTVWSTALLRGELLPHGRISNSDDLAHPWTLNERDAEDTLVRPFRFATSHFDCRVRRGGGCLSAGCLSAVVSASKKPSASGILPLRLHGWPCSCTLLCSADACQAASIQKPRLDTFCAWRNLQRCSDALRL